MEELPKFTIYINILELSSIYFEVQYKIHGINEMKFQNWFTKNIMVAKTRQHFNIRLFQNQKKNQAHQI